ncbi:hypothetical protein E8E13_007358 [Curvularia kusanoi]|uniref:Uncharacterized protein n=1 Tax=Curvularia kusanoi TaxID=90978 RepID=A0A9P4TDF9_CURKU|nr:hypothetical protein E8E13_007358 [Curvularia kusanoi]
MSQRTAATALLLASLPYSIALPQVLPSNVTARPFPIPAGNASVVTVVGTIVQPAVESAIGDVTDVIEDATTSSALEGATDALPTASILDPEANILPLILPGVLPVETDLPPLESDIPADAPSDLTSDAVSSTPTPSSDDDLPDTNSLEVIDLPEPTEVPDVPDFPDESTVPISTFNAVVQPLISVIQTLLNSLPGNFAPPLPGIFVHPLLPTETSDDDSSPTESPEIFVDPLLPTETLSDIIATATDLIESLLDPLADSEPTPAPSDTDLPFAERFAKRQASPALDVSGLLDALQPLLEAVKGLIARVTSVDPATAEVASGVLSEVESVASGLPTLPVAPVDVPALPLPTIALPDLPTPPLPVADVLPTDLPTPPEPLVLPPLPTDLGPALPDDVLNVPVPDEFQSIDWAAFQSPPIVEPPASVDEPVIPADVLNVPVPDFDDAGNIIDAVISTLSSVASDAPVPAATSVEAVVVEPLSVVSSVVATAPAGLPTSLDAFGDDLADWPFADIPEDLAPDATGVLPDLSDLPAPDVPTGTVAGLLLPVSAPTLAAPAGALPTDLFDLPEPDGFEFPDVTSIATAIPAPTTEPTIPDEVLNFPWPDLDANGIPIDTPLAPVAGPTIPSALPTNLNWWDIPVPDDFVDNLDAPALPTPTPELPDVLPDLPIPDAALNAPTPDFDENGVPVNLPAPALPDSSFGTGFPIQAFPDIPLILPSVEPTPIPTPLVGAAAATDSLTLVSTDALSGLPTSLNDAPDAVPTVIITPTAPASILPVVVPVAAGPAVVPAAPATPSLPFQVPSVSRPLTKRQYGLPYWNPFVPNPWLSNPWLANSWLTNPALNPWLPKPLVPSVPGIPQTTLPVVPPTGLPTGLLGAWPGALGALGAAGVPGAPGVPGVPSVPGIPGIPGALGAPGALPGLLSGAGLGLPLPGLSKAPLPSPTGVPSTLPTIVRPSILPALVKPSILPAPVVASILPAPVIASILPAPVRPSIRPAPVEPSTSPTASSIAPPIPAVSDVLSSLSSALDDVASILPQPVATVVSAVAELPTSVVDAVVGVVSAIPGIGEVLSGGEPALPSILPSAADVVAPDAAIASILATGPVADILTAVVPAASILPSGPVADLLTAVVPAASILPAGPVADILTGGAPLAGILPAAPSVPAAPAVASILPAAIANILPAAGPVAAAPAAPVIPVAPAVAPAVSKVTAAVAPIAGLLKLPTILPVRGPVRRAVEMQQGPASDWESFLGELDESHQSELTGLIHDSAKAVNNDNVDAMAATLKSDFDNLSADTKAQLVDGLASATTLSRRSMRHGRRQAIPGVQSIGPNLDDAQKLDLSSILGPSGSLDPNNMLSPGGGSFADPSPEDFIEPGTPLELADSSVNPVNSNSHAELAAIINAGGLDPNNMLNTAATHFYEAPEQDPYEDIRSNWGSALDASQPVRALEGLDATLQASQLNHIGSKKVPKLPFSPPAVQGNAAVRANAQVQPLAQAAPQGSVAEWFHRYVKPSLRKEVDAEIVR